MAWLMDTYSMHHGYSVPGVVTGKPLVAWGLRGARGGDRPRLRLRDRGRRAAVLDSTCRRERVSRASATPGRSPRG